MSKQKKPAFEWFCRGTGSALVCENGDKVLNIYTYGKGSHVSCSLNVAYLDIHPKAVYPDGKPVNVGGSGWRYQLSAFVGGAWNGFSLSWGDGPIRADSTIYATKSDAIKAALYQLVEVCDQKLLKPAYYETFYKRAPAQTSVGTVGELLPYRMFHPGREQLAYYMCLPDWEPFWQLLEEYTAHDNWLAEVRAPKKSAFVEQLDLF